MSLFAKIEAIATRIYLTDEVAASPAVKTQLDRWEQAGYRHFASVHGQDPMQLLSNPALLGAPIDHILTVRALRLAAGASSSSWYAGNLLTMRGLPRAPAAEEIRLDRSGNIEGFF